VLKDYKDFKVHKELKEEIQVLKEPLVQQVLQEHRVLKVELREHQECKDFKELRVPKVQLKELRVLKDQQVHKDQQVS
jgi:hypothetical protein